MGASSVGTNGRDVEIARSRDQADVEKMKLQLEIEKTKANSAEAQYKMYCDQQIKVAEISSAAITASAKQTSNLYDKYTTGLRGTERSSEQVAF